MRPDESPRTRTTLGDTPGFEEWSQEVAATLAARKRVAVDVVEDGSEKPGTDMAPERPTRRWRFRLGFFP